MLVGLTWLVCFLGPLPVSWDLSAYGKCSFVLRVWSEFGSTAMVLRLKKIIPSSMWSCGILAGYVPVCLAISRCVRMQDLFLAVGGSKIGGFCFCGGLRVRVSSSRVETLGFTFIDCICSGSLCSLIECTVWRLLKLSLMVERIVSGSLCSLVGWTHCLDIAQTISHDWTHSQW